MSEKSTEWFRLLEGTIGQISQHFFDDFVEENVERKMESGVDSVIIRRQIGKCCDWCANLVGVYDYGSGDYPDDIFRRHKNCKCLVTVKTKSGGYQDVWTKKRYGTQREARIARNEGRIKEQLNEQQYNEARNKAAAAGKKYFDATEYWRNKQKEYPAKTVIEKGKFTFKGKEYNVRESGIKSMPGKEEIAVGEWWVDRYGGELHYVPRILGEKTIKTPDFDIVYETERMFLELKTPKGASNWTISHQIESAELQAENVIIDLKDSALKLSEVKEQIDKIMKHDDFPWLKRLMIKNGNELTIVKERV